MSQVSAQGAESVSEKLSKWVKWVQKLSKWVKWVQKLSKWVKWVQTIIQVSQVSAEIIPVSQVSAEIIKVGIVHPLHKVMHREEINLLSFLKNTKTLETTKCT